MSVKAVVSKGKRWQKPAPTEADVACEQEQNQTR